MYFLAAECVKCHRSIQCNTRSIRVALNLRLEHGAFGLPSEKHSFFVHKNLPSCIQPVHRSPDDVSPSCRPPEQISLRWQGVLGPVANILPRGRTDDPRAATAPSRTALEILDLMEKDTLAHHAVIAGAGNGGGGGGSRWSSDKVQRQGQPVREARVGVLAVEGELVALGVEGGGWQQLGDEGPAAEACSEERYR